MENFAIWFEELLGLNPDIQVKLLESLLTVVLLWLGHRLLTGILSKSIKNIEVRYQWQKGIGYLVTAVGIITIGRIWLAGMSTLVTFFGLVSAGIAIALKDPLMNVAGWMYILARKPFDVGDRIEVSGVAGDVIDIRVFQFSIMEIGNWVNADQSTGRVLHIPNGVIFTSVLGNYTRGFQYIWNELEVLITFESNWRSAKEILQKIIDDFSAPQLADIDASLNETSQPYMIKPGKTTPIVYTSVHKSGILLSIRYLCNPRHRRSSTSILWESTLSAFANESDIQLAYPTQRFYSSSQENSALWKEESLPPLS